MRLFTYCALSLVLAVIAAAAIGYVPTQRHWGDEGLRSMFAVSGICLAAALLAAAPLAVVAQYWPTQIGQAALAGTVIRLLATIAGCVGYQIIAKPQMSSFLTWATIMYLLLLAIETTFGVFAIRRFYRVTPTKKEGTAS